AGGHVFSSWGVCLCNSMRGNHVHVFKICCARLPEEPYILGHGCLIGADVPAAAVGVAAGYYFWRWLKRPCWREALLGGLVLGLAELCKFTLLVFYPLLP